MRGVSRRDSGPRNWLSWGGEMRIVIDLVPEDNSTSAMMWSAFDRF